MMDQPTLCRGTAVAIRSALAITLVLGFAHAADAGSGKWTLSLEPMQVQVYGHDQHALTVHRIDLGAMPPSDDKTAFSLDLESDFAPRTELRRMGPKWGWGLDLFWFVSAQTAPTQSATGNGASQPVAFEVADRTFTSTGSGDVLFYRLLEDNDMALWTVDLYALKPLIDNPDGSGLTLQLGLRVGDFDNDYRAIVGIDGKSGRRLDSSSNYGRMNGPLIGLIGHVRLGSKNRIETYLGQSLILGEAQYNALAREFTGPFSETPNFVSQEEFEQLQDVAIPITEFRVKWTYDVSGWLALGVGANTAVWWDVGVPPGVIPGAGGDQVLHENTIVLFGVLASAKITF